VSGIDHLQDTMGNRAARTMLQTGAEPLKTGSTTGALPRFTHDFRQITVHPRSPASVQPKLTVGTAGDIFEQEADRVAAQLTHMPEPGFKPPCACGGECSECRKAKTPVAHGHERLQTKRVESSDPKQTAIPPIVQEALRSPGQPIDPASRASMERRFGHDFSRVRVHTDNTAAESARALQSRAYTVGSDVVFASAQFAPSTSAGQSLLAHELTHVVQQSGGGLALQRAPDSGADSGIHVTADEAEKAVARSRLGPLDQLDAGDPDRLCGGSKCFDDEEINAQLVAENKRIDEEIRREREISATPYTRRFHQAQSYAAQVDAESDKHNLTGEEVWNAGVRNDLFLEHDKELVLADQEEFRNEDRARREEADKYIRRKAESDAYRAQVDRSEQASSPAGFIQPLAFAAVSPEVGAVYAGMQIAAMTNETYEACAHGTTADCVGAAGQVAIALATDVALRRGLSETPRQSVGGDPVRSGAVVKATPGAGDATSPRSPEPVSTRQAPVGMKPKASPKEVQTAPATTRAKTGADEPPASRMPAKKKTGDTERAEKSSRPVNRNDERPAGAKGAKKTPAKRSGSQAKEETPQKAARKTEDDPENRMGGNETRTDQEPQEVSETPATTPDPDDPQRGVKEGLDRAKQRITEHRKDIDALNKQISEARQETHSLEKQVENIPRDDPSREEIYKRFKRAEKRLEELIGRRDNAVELLQRDQEVRDKLQKALDEKTYLRPKFHQSVVRKAWDLALQAGKGKVFSPGGGEIKNFDDPWVMGHKPKYEFWKHQRSAAERGISREQFTDEFNRDPSHYRPETKADNESHKYEDKTDAYLGY
jgi:hypothetical protein